MLQKGKKVKCTSGICGCQPEEILTIIGVHKTWDKKCFLAFLEKPYFYDSENFKCLD